MILTFKAQCGSIVNLQHKGEIQGIEFLDSLIEFRFLQAGSPISEWMSAESGFVSLLRPISADAQVHTRGLDAANLAIETRGLGGTFTLLVWPSE